MARKRTRSNQINSQPMTEELPITVEDYNHRGSFFVGHDVPLNDFLIGWRDLSLKASRSLLQRKKALADDEDDDETENEAQVNDQNREIELNNHTSFQSIRNQHSSTSSSSSSSDSSAVAEEIDKRIQKKKQTIKSQTHQHIFAHLSGCARSGQVTAIIGPSGCGKTSLLRALAGLQAKQRLEGEIRFYFADHLPSAIISTPPSPQLGPFTQPDTMSSASHSNVNLLPFNQNVHKDASTSFNSKVLFSKRKPPRPVRLAFIPQYDQFHEHLTCSQVLMMSLHCARAGFGQHMASQPTEAQTNLWQLLRLVQLESVAGTVVKRLSGGQRKRLSVAQELSYRPDILVLDEPTSGLDSLASFECVRTLRKLSRKWRPLLILMSIHQPGPDTYRQLDQLQLLSKQGTLLYGGPVQFIDQYLAGCALQRPAFTGMAEYLLRLASGEMGKKVITRLQENFSIPISAPPASEQGLDAIAAWLGEYRASLESNVMGQEMQEKRIVSDQNQSQFGQSGSSAYAGQSATDGDPTLAFQMTYSVKVRECVGRPQTRLRLHFRCLLRRYLWLMQSDFTFFKLRLISYFVSGLFIGWLYGSVGKASGCPVSLEQLQKEKGANSDSSASLPTMDMRLLSVLGERNRETFFKMIDNTSNLFFTVLIVELTSALPVLVSLSEELPVLRRELRNGHYGFGAFFAAKTLVDSVLLILMLNTYILVTYFLNGQLFQSRRLLLTLEALTWTGLIAESQALIIASVFSENLFVSVYVGVSTSIAGFLFTGFLIKVQTLAKPFYEISKYIYARHAYEAVLITLYGNGRCQSNAESQNLMQNNKRMLLLLLNRAAEQLRNVPHIVGPVKQFTEHLRRKRNLLSNSTAPINLQMAVMRLVLASFGFNRQSGSTLDHFSSVNLSKIDSTNLTTTTLPYLISQSLSPTTKFSEEFFTFNGSSKRRWPSHLDLNDVLEVTIPSEGWTITSQSVSSNFADDASTHPSTFGNTESSDLFSANKTTSSWKEESDEEDFLSKVNRNRWPDYAAHRYSKQSLTALIDILFHKMGIVQKEPEKEHKVESRMLRFFQLEESELSFKFIFFLCNYLLFRFLAFFLLRWTALKQI